MSSLPRRPALATLLLLGACAGGPATNTPAAAAPAATGTRAGAATAAGSSTTTGGPVIAIEGARIFDGEHLTGPGTVLIRGQRIAAVGASVAVPPGAKVIDAHGKTLLPGLIDSHIHVWDPASLHQAAVFGVTTVLDMLTQPTAAAALRKAVATRSDLADLRSAGFAATAPGGHGTEYGFKAPTLSKPAQAQAFVNARLSEGSDYIKIIEDDGSVYGIHFNSLDRATVAAVIAAAHARGKMAVIHIATQADARAAIEAGVDGLAHIFTDTPPAPDFAQVVLAHHAFVVPTLSVNMSVSGHPAGAALVADPALAPFLSPDDTARLEKAFPHYPGGHADYANAQAAVRALNAAGVPILAGTDAPNPGTTYGASMHGELELLVKAGLTPTQALTAATAAPARVFHLEDRGRIQPGLRADLLLVDGDPTQDIRATRHIAGVWLEGVAVDRAAYRAEVAKARSAPPAADKAPAPELGDGHISRFDDMSKKTGFGAGWDVTTDAITGGTSKATLTVVAHGAHRSKGALRVSGTVAKGAQYQWAGAMFSPGAQPMQAADLSARTGFSFATRGDGKTYMVMLFAKSHGFQPFDPEVHRDPPLEGAALQVRRLRQARRPRPDGHRGGGDHAGRLHDRPRRRHPRVRCGPPSRGCSRPPVRRRGYRWRGPLDRTRPDR